MVVYVMKQAYSCICHEAGVCIYQEVGVWFYMS